MERPGSTESRPTKAAKVIRSSAVSLFGRARLCRAVVFRSNAFKAQVGRDSVEPWSSLTTSVQLLLRRLMWLRSVATSGPIALYSLSLS